MLNFKWKNKLSFLFVAILLTVFLIPLAIDSYHVHSIINSLMSEYGRIDLIITNSSSDGSITIINQDSSVMYSEPSWIKNKFGQGGVLNVAQKLSWQNHKVQFKSNGDCNLSISFAGIDSRVSEKRHPVFSEYRNLQVNGIYIPLKQSVTWHDSRETHSLFLNDGDVATISFDIRRHMPRSSDWKSNEIDFDWKIILGIFAFTLFISNKFVNSFEWRTDRGIITNNKKVYYDALRVFSIFFVIFNHTDGFHYYLKAKETGMAEFFYVSLSSFTKFAVPMFFMLSGALLLGKIEPLKTIFLKRISRFTCIIIFFTLFTVYIYYLNGNSITFDEIWRGVLNKNLPWTTPYWFLYAYLGLLIFLPFIRKIAVNMTKSEFILLFCVNTFFTGMLPLINLILTYFKIENIEISGYLKSVLQFAFTSAIFYPLIGYWIDNHVDVNKFKRRHVLMLFGSIILAITITAIATIVQKNMSGKFTQELLSCLVFFIVVPLFLIAKILYSIEPRTKIRAWVYSVTSLIAPLTFFVYLIDLPLKSCIWIHISKLLFEIYSIDNFPVTYSILWVAISITISSIIAYILRKSSFIKMYI